MEQEKVGYALCGIGGILAGIALIKFVVIGYYPDELPLFGSLLVIGSALTWAGTKVFTNARSKGDN